MTYQEQPRSQAAALDYKIPCMNLVQKIRYIKKALENTLTGPDSEGSHWHEVIEAAARRFRTTTSVLITLAWRTWGKNTYGDVREKKPVRCTEATADHGPVRCGSTIDRTCSMCMPASIYVAYVLSFACRTHERRPARKTCVFPKN